MVRILRAGKGKELTGSSEVEGRKVRIRGGGEGLRGVGGRDEGMRGKDKEG